ncbi:hypothetical protein Afil01_09550 [Actinorhabdospora filicis]|uniref:Glycosyltransferase involved in cell wall biosynthesis n=1 Tax=Actinorhabdospora filicis TaxID=1785913 RepID=A0A9W6W7P8_9ACTN|nr:glycosyltransferase family 4 protein [Actinorhabdospora filicis]GLZ76148.1 hypothetical protein Afil01_09550 [Actinorhabdospora filicis]
MRIAVFVEDARARAAAHSIVTAARDAGHDAEVLADLVAPGEAVADADLPDLLESRVRARLAGADRLVLFTDRTPYGQRLSRSFSRELPVTLVQDRHHAMVWRVEGAAGERDAFAATGPAAVCVWGPKGVRDAGPDTAVAVTGFPGLSDDPDLLRAARSAVHRRGRTGPLRILIADEPPGKPSQWREAARELRAHGEVDVRVEPGPPDVDGYDLVITALSTLYPATLLAGVPLVHYTTGPCVFPPLRHPLVRSAATIGELGEIALRLAADGVFRGNAAGEPVEHHLAFLADPAARIVDAVTAAAMPGPRPAAAPVKRSRTLSERALDDLRERVRRPRSLAVLGTDFTYQTGVAVPVLTYTRELVASAPVDVRYVDVTAFTTLDEIAAAIEGCETVLINSLAFFWRHAIGGRFAERLLGTGVPTVVYAHETAYVYAHEAATRGERHELLERLMPRLRLLCVSRAQADFYRGLGAVDPLVVYNTVPDDDRPPHASAGVGERPRVVMVGSVQDRKGADLFSRVAERAHLDGLPWDFAWYGQRSARLGANAMLSPLVDWRGALPRRRVREELAAADVLLLPSLDDPMPLAVVEAVQQRLRIVTYDKIGSREILGGVRGYRAFGEYTPGAALDAVAAVLDDEVDAGAYAEIADLFAPARFAERMSLALSL